MGLLKNLSLLFSDSLLGRMTELERRQELLEDYTDQKLDMMKSYSARVHKRERDAERKGSPRNDESEATDGLARVARENPAVARILARRNRVGRAGAL